MIKVREDIISVTERRNARVHTAIPTPVIPTPAIPTPAIPNPNPIPNPIVSIASVGKAGVGKAGAPRNALCTTVIGQLME